MHLKQLQNAGLSENEAKVYLAALELGETSVYRLAKKSAVKRTTTYLAVETLKEKGLMNAYNRNNVVICYAENPKKLVEKMEEKKQALSEILPELLAMTNLIDRKPKIQYFENEEAYKEVFKDALNYPNEEILITFNEKFYNFDNFFLDHFIPKRKEKKIWARVLLADNPALKNIAQDEAGHFFKSKIVPSANFKIEIEMVIYGKNKLGLVSYDENLAIIIESQKIHDTQKSLFETIWEMLPEK